MKKKRRYLCSVALGSKVYAIGGYDGAGRLNSVECYDVITQEWTTAASMVHRRGLAGAAVLNGKIVAGLCRWSDNNMRGGGGESCFCHSQKRACLLQPCYLVVIKPISGCVPIACSDLMITSLLQVVNRLDAS